MTSAFSIHMRYAFRTLIKTPGFSVIAIATIALGIAANTAIFSVVNAVLLRPLPFRDESRVVTVRTSTADERKSNHSAGDFLDIERNNRTLEALAGFRGDVAAVAVNPAEPTQLQALWVTSSFFDVFGTPAALGRTFSRTQNATPGERLVVLSDATWRKLFGADAGAVGRRIRINGEAYTVAAVMPRGFEWPEGTPMWMLSQRPVPPSPIDIKDQDPLTNRDVRYFEAVGRLKPGVSLADARQDLHLIATALQQQHPQSSAGRDVRAVPVREDLTEGVRDALLVIQGAVGLVLLVACANVSSLLLARATGKRRELAIRAALGAGRGHLLRQLLAESVVLGLAGGVAGLLLSAWLVVLLVRVLPGGLPRTDTITLDTTVMIVTVVASLLTGLLFGILPALQASRAAAADVIKEAGERGSTRARGRTVLVVAEIALTLVLLVGAALLGTSFLHLQRVDPGFNAEHVTVADLGVPQTRYPKGADQTRLYHRLIEGLSQRPELQAVGVGFPGPLHGANASGTFYVEGRASTTHADKPFARFGTVSGGYFAAMGIPLLAGRAFTDRDGENAPGVAIVSAALAKRYWPGESPVGKRLRFEDKATEPWVTVVGLIGDVRQLGLAEAAPALLYLPYEQFPLPFTTLAVRSLLPAATVTSLMRAQLAAIDPDLPFSDTSTLRSVLTQSVDEPRFRAMLIGIFALLALILATVGVYGLISYTVTQRTREIGIRVALGAAPRQVLIPVIREGVMLALAGIGIGLIGAFAAMRALTAFLFGIGASDPLTFGGVALLLLAVATLASYIPSRRALRVDPMVALRAE
jgi:putative ABC transport system permease protein